MRSSTAALAAAVAAGYVMGRTKKTKLAVALGTCLAGARGSGGPHPSPLQDTVDRLRGELLTAGQAAVLAADRWLTGVADRRNADLYDEDAYEDDAYEDDYEDDYDAAYEDDDYEDDANEDAAYEYGEGDPVEDAYADVYADDADDDPRDAASDHERVLRRR
ncbi:hypothetical protein AQJ66_04680 [Streptomyces bungoensis]|uniref:DNA primase n=1 Tax=Streptomyces bungoensis TaxID=285568 RepID=A0A124I5C0_9ACTN|nr:hypothetical protein [Streptomyces bungoensis]KUN89461.1 hypothetical protein AQJ66_04680 [Streptomyces bungoensis]